MSIQPDHLPPEAALRTRPPAAGHITATYRIRGTLDAARAVARAIAYEQTVELPEALVTDPYVREHVVGRVVDVQADGAGHALASLAYSTDLGHLHLAQLLNLSFGNVSIYPGVRLLDLELPDALLARFPGPLWGIEGLRAALGVYGRPLLATAVKPNGADIAHLAALAGAFALGGGDIVKDDQNLIDDFERFKRRVAACAEAVAAANAQTGRRCLYLPHVSGAGADLRRQMEYTRELGLAGVLACPMATGLDTVRTLGRELGLMLMAHPSLTGTYTNSVDAGIDHGLLLGTLFRLAGADISIFPNAGGRFSFAPDECAGVADALREPLGNLAPAWPAPAGGMDYTSLPGICRTYGADTVILIGGALLGHDPDLRVATQTFVERIEAECPARYVTPAPAPTRGQPDPRQRVLAFREGFEWAERPSSAYKSAADAADAAGTGAGFKDVRRVELIGKYGERSNSDLRYFEVGPGGRSSRERHLHTHIIIGARGHGVLAMGNRQVAIGPMDVAYVEPLEVHQLLNPGTAPFGFFCIVDHQRDRPASA